MMPDAAEIAARHDLLELVLAAAQKVFQIRRPRPDRIAGPLPHGPSDRSPMGHRPDFSTAFDSSPRRAGELARARFGRSGFIGDRQVPYNAAWLCSS